MKMLKVLMISMAMALGAGCGSEDVPQAHKGQMFGQTGALAFYGGTVGLYGPVLGPGTHYTGVYDTIKMIDCSTQTMKETLPTMSKDNVHVDVDVYVTFKANCDDNTVTETLKAISPAKGNSIEAQQLYDTFIRNSMGEALRLAVAPINAFDINADREKIHDAAETKFNDSVKKLGAPVTIMAFKINNLIPPKSLVDANADLAQQQVLKQKSLAERDKVAVEVETMKTKGQLKAAEGTADAAKIEAVGKALRAYPEYMQWTQLGQLPGIYEKAGASGNLIVLPNNPNMLMNLPTPKAVK